MFKINQRVKVTETGEIGRIVEFDTDNEGVTDYEGVLVRMWETGEVEWLNVDEIEAA